MYNKNDALKLNSTGAISVTSTATMTQFTRAIITNDSQATCYIGTSNAVTTANGYPVVDGAQVFVTGKVWIITASTSSLRYAEVE